MILWSPHLVVSHLYRRPPNGHGRSKYGDFKVLNNPIGQCQHHDCTKEPTRFFVWPLFADGTGESIGGEYCRKHAKFFKKSNAESTDIREVTKAEYAVIQVMES